MLSIPEGLENLKLPNPELISYYRETNERIISIYEEIDESLLEYSKLILMWNKEDIGIPTENRKPIKVRIYSYGGDIEACYSFISIVRLSNTPVYTYNMGVAMSAALLILLSGKKRFCIPLSTALIHSGSTSMTGSFEQVKEGQKNYEKLVKYMREYILANTKIGVKLFNKNSKIDWYLSDDEQLEYGIVESIIDDIDELI